MAASPELKVYAPNGKYEAACKHAETAAVIVAFLGKGAKIRHCHRRTVWHEGFEDYGAAESYDYVARLVESRIRNGKDQ